jgi:hypothetical protein
LALPIGNSVPETPQPSASDLCLAELDAAKRTPDSETRKRQLNPAAIHAHLSEQRRRNTSSNPWTRSLSRRQSRHGLTVLPQSHYIGGITGMSYVGAPD